MGAGPHVAPCADTSTGPGMRVVRTMLPCEACLAREPGRRCFGHTHQAVKAARMRGLWVMLRGSKQQLCVASRHIVYMYGVSRGLRCLGRD